MPFRLKAFAYHLLGSALALTLVFGALWLGWYRWPGWYLASALSVAPLVAGVDLALGPLVTGIIANPGKPRRELKRDISIVVAVQLLALGYGAFTLWKGRPLYYTLSKGLDMVQAAQIDAHETALARQQNPVFAPHWYSLPRWVWARLPDNADEAKKIIAGAVFGGTDVTQMPRYFRPWEQGLPELATQLRKLDDQQYFSRPQREILARRMAALGVARDRPVTLVMWGKEKNLLAVFDNPVTPHLKAILRAD
ncbi:MAG: hypothetical protein JSR67_01280 [Proteobacteria bacterium]|nr:hypothetical protein [Pseudomonadota bacterium]